MSKGHLLPVKEAGRKYEEGIINDYSDNHLQAAPLTDRDNNVRGLQDDVNNVHKVSLDTLRDQIFKMNKVIDSLPANNNGNSQNALPNVEK